MTGYTRIGTELGPRVHQILQDLLGDLTGSPAEIKLFHPQVQSPKYRSNRAGAIEVPGLEDLFDCVTVISLGPGGPRSGPGQPPGTHPADAVVRAALFGE
jgi:hypothetical protein